MLICWGYAWELMGAGLCREWFGYPVSRGSSYGLLWVALCDDGFKNSRVLLLGSGVKLGGEALLKQGMRSLIRQVEVSGEQLLSSGFNGVFTKIFSLVFFVGKAPLSVIFFGVFVDGIGGV